ncbi:MAG: ABC transporter permease [Microscillaceae bacterium]|jgi:predicted permease|nr:ABC transporter permease [Microscillaceae bacterium]
MLKNYLKIAFRNLWRNKNFTAINIVGLAIGINACLIIYLLVSYELSFDTFQADKDRIYRVVSNIKIAGKEHKNSGVSGGLAAAVKSDVAGLDAVSPFHLVYFKHIWIHNYKNRRQDFDYLAGLADKDHPRDAVVADADFFKIFKQQWLVGNPQTALREPFQLVLTVSKAQKYFGNIPLDKLLGRTLTYMNFSDTVTVKVNGIVADWQYNSDFKFNEFISFATLTKTNWGKNLGIDNWTSTNSSSQLLVKLSRGTQAANIEKKFPQLIRKYQKEQSTGFERNFALQALSDVHFNRDYGGNNIKVAHLPTLYGLVGIAGFLLLIAAINFINLATAQSAQRAKEIGVRKVLGSSRWNLIRQFLTEAFILAVLATGLSLVVAEPMLWLFSDFVVEEVRTQLFSPKVLVFLAGIILTTTLLSGFYPAWVLSSLLPVASLKNQTSGRGSRKSGLRQALIIFQFAFAQVFIIGTIVVSWQIQYMLNRDMGFAKDAVVSFSVPWYDESNTKLILLDKLKQIPEIKLVSLSQSTPAETGHSTTLIHYKESGKKTIETDVHRKSADENYLKLYEIKLLAGRNIKNSDTLRELLINETYCKILGFKRPEDALGKDLWMGLEGTQKLPIVGVFTDFNLQPLHQAIQPTFIGCENKYSSEINLKLYMQNRQITDFQAIVKKVEKEWQALYPNERFEYEILDDKIAKFYDKEQKIAHLLSIATAVAIFISCIGLFGLVTYAVETRTKEIGIRKVLGATVAQITALLSFDFLRLVFISIVIASPIAYYFAQQWLTDFAYRMELGGLVFVTAAMIAIVITLLTVSLRAIRAALRNPVESLRYE